jgi:aspartyl-tRNA(Asn)/glutamyl-tRNA(Gln) amidotransferase subunit C
MKGTRMMDKETVQHIASLARLVVTEEEISVFTKQIGSILHYVETLSAADTAGVEPMASVSPRHDPLRDDEVQASMPREKLLQNGPDIKNDCFAVPKMM